MNWRPGDKSDPENCPVAEVARLREALEQIERNVGFGDYFACACITDPHGPKVTCNCANEFRRIARAALAAASATGGEA